MSRATLTIQLAEEAMPVPPTIELSKIELPIVPSASLVVSASLVFGASNVLRASSLLGASSALRASSVRALDVLRTSSVLGTSSRTAVLAMRSRLRLLAAICGENCGFERRQRFSVISGHGGSR